MTLFDRLRVLLGIGCRRVRAQLGLPEDRRQRAERRDLDRSRAAAEGHGARLASDRWPRVRSTNELGLVSNPGTTANELRTPPASRSP